MLDKLSQSEMNITCVANDDGSASYFTKKTVTLNGDNKRMLSEQISAMNFRLRNSGADYESGWHVAGDPTLIIVRSGILRIALRNGDYRDFKAGDIFIAQDRLQENEVFDSNIHGHTAELIGDDVLLALHIKLAEIKK